MLIDSHTHLDMKDFDKDRSQVIERAMKAGITHIITIGTDLTSSVKALQLANVYDFIFSSIGYHPHNAENMDPSTLKELSGMAAESKIVAWGEIGLDFNRMHSPRKDQERWLIRQLEIAETLDLPLIFHERDSQGRLLEILKTTTSTCRPAVVHCFSGTGAELDRYLEMGFYIGITGIVTVSKRGKPLRQMIPSIPPDRLLIETDAPYLTPTPQRNKYRRNEPAFVREVLFKVAEVRKEDPAALVEQIWDNTCRLFRINPKTS